MICDIAYGVVTRGSSSTRVGQVLKVHDQQLYTVDGNLAKRAGASS